MLDSSSRFGGVSRRDFIRDLSAGALVTPVTAREAQARCLPGSGDETSTQGVASGDPLQRRVMLWTRIAPRRVLLPCRCAGKSRTIPAYHPYSGRSLRVLPGAGQRTLIEA